MEERGVENMLKMEFVRSLNCNFVRVLLEDKPEENRYQYCVLTRGGIQGVLDCNLRYLNGLAYLYYDITSRQSVAQLYCTRPIQRKWVQDFLWSMQSIRQELERFLLDISHVIWYPEQIYQEIENSQFSFIYIPYYEGDGGFLQLLDFLLEHIDYEDELLVNCVYKIYEQYERNGDAYLQAGIFEDAKCLENTGTGDAVNISEVSNSAALENFGDTFADAMETVESRERAGIGGSDSSVDRGDRDRSNVDRGSRDRSSADRGSRDRSSVDRGDRDRSNVGRGSRDRSSVDRGGRDRSNVGRGDSEGKEIMTAMSEENTEAVTEFAAKEERIRPFWFWDNRRKKNSQARQEYNMRMEREMNEAAVAEEPIYEEECGKTVFIANTAPAGQRLTGLYTQQGQCKIRLDKKIITVGKKRGEVDLVLEDASVSRLHARITKDADHVYLEDLNSTNGTFKNGLPMEPYEKRMLEEGDEIIFGRVCMHYR